MSFRVKDITGERFGMLTVIGYDHSYKTRTYWNCLCDCGNTRIVSKDHLKRLDTTDCGCTRKHIPTSKKHGMSRSRLYSIWSLMKARCSNPNRPEYKHYGGRGICVYDGWLKFEAFAEWAKANGYNENLTIDRIDNNGNYCPDNCRWVTQKEQTSNTRKNRYITYNGETKTITQWATEYGLEYYQLKNRLDRFNWSFERAITEPIHLKYSNKKGG